MFKGKSKLGKRQSFIINTVSNFSLDGNKFSFPVGHAFDAHKTSVPLPSAARKNEFLANFETV